jgi:hypothetical protein
MVFKNLSVLLPNVAAGLEFIPENGGGTGIRFQERKN